MMRGSFRDHFIFCRASVILYIARIFLALITLLGVHAVSEAAAPIPKSGNTISVSLKKFQDQMICIDCLFTDPDGGKVVSAVLTSLPSIGIAEVNFEAIFYVAPYGSSNYSTSFTFKAVDQQGEQSAPFTVNITVGNSLDPAGYPAGSPVVVYTVQGEVGWTAAKCSGGPSNLYQGPPLTQPAFGTSGWWGELIVFTPNPTFTGSGSYQYVCHSMRNGDDGTNLALAPSAVNVFVSPTLKIATNEDSPKTVTLGPTGSYSYQITQQPDNGTATISGGTLTFTPSAHWHGQTSLKFVALYSTGGGSLEYTIPITVTSVNDVPVVANKTLVVNEDTSGSVGLTVTDPDLTFGGDSHSFEIVSGPASGVASISGTTLMFTPPANWNGATSLTYRARDAAGAYSAAATVAITVNPVNDAPVAAPKSVTVNEDTTATVTLTATDIDSPVPTVFQIVAGPNAAYGTASITGAVLTFAPVNNWHGSGTLTYRAQDSSGAWSAPVTVSISVQSVNDAPQPSGSGMTLRTIESKTTTVTVRVMK